MCDRSRREHVTGTTASFGTGPLVNSRGNRWEGRALAGRVKLKSGSFRSPETSSPALLCFYKNVISFPKLSGRIYCCCLLTGLNSLSTDTKDISNGRSPSAADIFVVYHFNSDSVMAVSPPPSDRPPLIVNDGKMEPWVITNKMLRGHICHNTLKEDMQRWAFSNFLFSANEVSKVLYCSCNELSDALWTSRHGFIQ